MFWVSPRNLGHSCTTMQHWSVALTNMRQMWPAKQRTSNTRREKNLQPQATSYGILLHTSEPHDTQHCGTSCCSHRLTSLRYYGKRQMPNLRVLLLCHMHTEDGPLCQEHHTLGTFRLESIRFHTFSHVTALLATHDSRNGCIVLSPSCRALFLNEESYRAQTSHLRSARPRRLTRPVLPMPLPDVSQHVLPDHSRPDVAAADWDSINHQSIPPHRQCS